MAVPKWLDNDKEREKWQKPWTVSPSSYKDKDFKRKCWEHGYVSPNFTRKEASGKYRNPQYGTDVPESLRTKCQYHAFCLERARHELGDKSMSPDGWYRNSRHNAAVGGASRSQHMLAWGTDWFPATRTRLGGEKFDNAMDRAFANGGRGYQSYVGGPIRHVDNGDQRVWVYA